MAIVLSPAPNGAENQTFHRATGTPAPYLVPESAAYGRRPRQAANSGRPRPSLEGVLGDYARFHQKNRRGPGLEEEPRADSRTWWTDFCLTPYSGPSPAWASWSASSTSS